MFNQFYEVEQERISSLTVSESWQHKLQKHYNIQGKDVATIESSRSIRKGQHRREEFSHTKERIAQEISGSKELIFRSNKAIMRGKLFAASFAAQRLLSSTRLHKMLLLFFPQFFHLHMDTVACRVVELMHIFHVFIAFFLFVTAKSDNVSREIRRRQQPKRNNNVIGSFRLSVCDFGMRAPARTLLSLLLLNDQLYRGEKTCHKSDEEMDYDNRSIDFIFCERFSRVHERLVVCAREKSTGGRAIFWKSLNCCELKLIEFESFGSITFPTEYKNVIYCANSVRYDDGA